MLWARATLVHSDPWAVSKQQQSKFKMDEEAVGATDNIVTEFATYEDFLDSQITPLDLYYLEVMFL